MSDWQNGRLKNWAINAVLLVGSLAVALLLTEVALRLVGFSNPVLWTYDDITGSRLYPRAEGWFRSEGEAYIRISEAGLRDREHVQPKPPNTFRIAVLGDSMAEALQVPLEATFWSVLERQLGSCVKMAGKNIEVINFGVSGYGTAQELLTFQHRALAYSPDLTILAFYAGNDVRNNSRALEPNRLRPFFVLQDGKLIADRSFLTDPAFLSYKSTFDYRSKLFELRTFQLMRQVKAAIEQWRQAASEDLEAGADDKVFLPPASKEWRDAWEVTERLIAATRDAVAAGGSRFVVASIPIGIQAHPDGGERIRFAHKLGVEDLWYPDRRLRDFASRDHIDLVTLGQRFQSHAEANRVYLHGFQNTKLGTGHLNEAGHRLIGETLAAYLCQP